MAAMPQAFDGTMFLNLISTLPINFTIRESALGPVLTLKGFQSAILAAFCHTKFHHFTSEIDPFHPSRLRRLITRKLPSDRSNVV